MSEDIDAVLRLVWHPSHFKDGVLKGSAFSSRDLTGQKDNYEQRSYLSVDDEQLVCQRAVDWIIESQQSDGKDISHGRAEALFARFRSGDLCSIADMQGRILLCVEREPIDEGTNGEGAPENHAHCGVKCLIADELDTGQPADRRQIVTILRTYLCELINRPEPRPIYSYNELFRHNGDAA